MEMVMKKIASDTVVSECSQRVSAIKKYLGAKDELFVNGEQVKATAVAQMFQDALDTRATAVTAKGDYKSALAARNTAEANRLSADAALQPYVMQRFGANSTEAHDFGYAPRKVADKTAMTKAKAALLNMATREARGTTSKKAKQQIKGTLSPEAAAALGALAGSTPAASGSAVTPAPAPSAATPAPAPSASAVAPAASASAAPPAAAPAVASTPLVAPATNGAILNGSAHS
jgi:hypothetical protein